MDKGLVWPRLQVSAIGWPLAFLGWGLFLFVLLKDEPKSDKPLLSENVSLIRAVEDGKYYVAVDNVVIGEISRFLDGWYASSRNDSSGLRLNKYSASKQEAVDAIMSLHGIK